MVILEGQLGRFQHLVNVSSGRHSAIEDYQMNAVLELADMLAHTMTPVPLHRSCQRTHHSASLAVASHTLTSSVVVEAELGLVGEEDVITACKGPVEVTLGPLLSILATN